MHYLLKEEPANYHYDAFAKDGGTTWTGVKNPVAQKHLRSIRKGDAVFYYHTGNEKADCRDCQGGRRRVSRIRPTPPARRTSSIYVPVKKLQAPRDARGGQGRQAVQGLSADLPAPLVGHARHRWRSGRRCSRLSEKGVGRLTPKLYDFTNFSIESAEGRQCEPQRLRVAVGRHGIACGRRLRCPRSLPPYGAASLLRISR